MLSTNVASALEGLRGSAAGRVFNMQGMMKAWIDGNREGRKCVVVTEDVKVHECYTSRDLDRAITVY